MKRIVYTFCLCLSTLLAEAQMDYRIIADLGGSLSGHLLLITNVRQGIDTLGQTDMVNGKFSFAGKVACPMVAQIVTPEASLIATLMLENTGFSLKAGQNGIEISGGKAQQVWESFRAVRKAVVLAKNKAQMEAREAYGRKDAAKMQSIQDRFKAVVTEAQQRNDSLLYANKDSFVAAYMLFTGMYRFDLASLSLKYEILGEAVKDSFYGKVIATRIHHLQQTAVGRIAPDFTVRTTEGDTISLRGVRGKVKLLDFWASWCGPCRQSNPELVAIYKTYHSKGLEIFSVSLDQDPKAWFKAVQEDGMVWKNGSELSGNASKVAALYDVRAIPYTLLLDKDNRIIAKNLHGKELEGKIRSLLD